MVHFITLVFNLLHNRQISCGNNWNSAGHVSIRKTGLKSRNGGEHLPTNATGEGVAGERGERRKEGIGKDKRSQDGHTIFYSKETE